MSAVTSAYYALGVVGWLWLSYHVLLDTLNSTRPPLYDLDRPVSFAKRVRRERRRPRMEAVFASVAFVVVWALLHWVVYSTAGVSYTGGAS